MPKPRARPLSSPVVKEYAVLSSVVGVHGSAGNASEPQSCHSDSLDFKAKKANDPIKASVAPPMKRLGPPTFWTRKPNHHQANQHPQTYMDAAHYHSVDRASSPQPVWKPRWDRFMSSLDNRLMSNLSAHPHTAEVGQVM
uniref:Uncharacterized protein n=1 Tax=Rhodosorus marinus TaxID=101924 RepID=A0A7S3EMJ0_9RHOD